MYVFATICRAMYLYSDAVVIMFYVNEKKTKEKDRRLKICSSRQVDIAEAESGRDLV